MEQMASITLFQFQDNVENKSFRNLQYQTYGKICVRGQQINTIPAYLFPVEPELTLPFKGSCISHLLLDELVNNVSGMHLYGDQGHNLVSLHLGEVSSDGLRELAERGYLLLFEAFQWFLVSPVLDEPQCLGDIPSPLYL